MRLRPVEVPAPPGWHAELDTVGVTGTNGKTSTTRLVAAALGQLQRPVAQVTTLGAFLDDEPFEISHDYDGFLSALRAGHERGGRFAAIELTSESLALGFIKAWPCRIGVFTNLSHDHLDAHQNPEHYLASKAQLFLHLPAGGAAVLNGCDPASELLTEIVPDKVRVIRYGVASRGQARQPLDLQARSVELSWQGTEIALEPHPGLVGHAGSDEPGRPEPLDRGARG